MEHRTTVNIAVSLHDAGGEHYVKAAAVMCVSMRLATNERLRLFVIHDETIMSDKRQKLRETIVAHDEVVFVDVNGFSSINKVCREFAQPEQTRAVYRRVFLVYILELDRILVCDADLTVLFDISRLWEEDLRGNVLSGVLRGVPHPYTYHELIGVPPEYYFRCGFLKIDLRAMRQD